MSLTYADTVMFLLDLCLLPSNAPGLWREIQTHLGKYFHLPQKLCDFLVKVDVQLSCVWVSDQQRCIEAGLGLCDLPGPDLQEHYLILNQHLGQSVVALDGLPCCRQLHELRDLLKYFHWPGDPPVQLS